MKNLFKFRIRAIALLALLLVSLTSAFAQKKIAIIDAGSSGSRLYVYEISQDGKSVKTLCIEEQNSLPLSGIPATEAGVGNYLSTMTGLYKNNDSEPIDLYVLATAGMRDEKKVNRDSAEFIYTCMNGQEINKFSIKKATTITGRAEGLYAWIALNYDLKHLGTSTSTTEKPLTYTSTPTVGIIEIGGASMQITFQAPNRQTYDKSDLIDRKGFSGIYSKSFLGAGVDRVFCKFEDNDAGERYSEVVKALPDLKNVSTVFYGLGKPIQIVADSVKYYSSFDRYIATLSSGADFHPLGNAYYIKWLCTKLWRNQDKIKSLEIKPGVSWTKGAALDIYINKGEIESFDYDNPN